MAGKLSLILTTLDQLGIYRTEGTRPDVRVCTSEGRDVLGSLAVLELIVDIVPDGLETIFKPFAELFEPGDGELFIEDFLDELIVVDDVGELLQSDRMGFELRVQVLAHLLEQVVFHQAVLVNDLQEVLFHQVALVFRVQSLESPGYIYIICHFQI